MNETSKKQRFTRLKPGRGKDDKQPAENSGTLNNQVDRLVYELRANEAELEAQTEQVRYAKEELERSRNLYAELYDFAPMGYLTVDFVSGQILRLNLTACRMLKVNRASFHSRLSRFIRPEYADVYHLCIREALVEPHESTCELKMNRSNGEVFWANLMASGFGHNREVLIAVADITERKNAEQVKDEFIGLVSHELRTPLTVIKGSISVARRADITPDERAELLQEAAASTENLSHILDNLIELSRYQSDRTRLEIAQTNVGRVVRDVLQSETARLNGHNFFGGIPDNLPDAPVDETRLREILHNLVDNALKYAPAKSQIKVTVKAQNDSVLVGVGNPGKGLTPEQQARLFEPFERLGQVSTSQPGLGLGLLVCKRLVEAHGGKIWVESRIGQGVTFWFSLPL
jgi:PAS domain S-box-containing protein